ncbi:hypothetical protein RRF57_005965 [Xylaria bambusicola]|uniref:Uncharacterized protein n=1 Tax=Xylaria bambusicola TaxID=326684 RepID=A0AAN7URB9_9PEZI
MRSNEAHDLEALLAVSMPPPYLLHPRAFLVLGADLPLARAHGDRALLLGEMVIWQEDDRRGVGWLSLWCVNVQRKLAVLQVESVIDDPSAGDDGRWSDICLGSSVSRRGSQFRIRAWDRR